MGTEMSRIMDGSPSKSSSKRKRFPDTLEGFGYHFNKEDRSMCNIDTGAPFQFVVKEGDQSYNQKHYEALGEVITEHIFGLLESECGLKRVPVPKDAPDKERSSFMFMSDDALSNPDKLLVLIHGSGVVRAGQWARRLIINDSLDSGTQIPFIKRAKKEGYGVIVMNTNYNVRKTSDGDVRLKGSESPEVHGSNVWVDYVQQSAARHIAIIAHSFGGCVTTSLFAKFKADFKNRVFAVAMTDSVHYISHPNAYRLLIKISQNWAASNQPLDTPLETRDGDIPRVSAGVGKHEETSWSSFQSIFPFLEDKLQRAKDLRDDECQEIRDTGDDNAMQQVEESHQKNNENETDMKQIEERKITEQQETDEDL